MLGVPDDPQTRDWVAITRDELPAAAAAEWAATPRSGAVVTFAGVVRDHAEGRAGVHSMTYEAYEPHAERAMRAICAEARSRWPDLEKVALLHRVGRLLLSEASVLAVVSSPHRGLAFDAARFCIDTLKETVPIWKQEHWEGGSGWAVDAREIRPVGATAGRPDARTDGPGAPAGSVPDREGDPRRPVAGT